jgi:hypothetical protein
MPEKSEIVVRSTNALATPLLTPRDRYLQRMEESRARLREAIDRVQQRAQELTPAAQISQRPIAWVLGALAFGLAFALLTARRR